MMFHLPKWINISFHSSFIMNGVVNFLIHFHLFYIISNSSSWDEIFGQVTGSEIELLNFTLQFYLGGGGFCFFNLFISKLFPYI